jgi:opacity protein-like surface antigen
MPRILILAWTLAILANGLVAAQEPVPGTIPPPLPPDAGCSGAADWERPFFDCCNHDQTDYLICDPCCGEAFYVASYFGATSVENFHRQIVLNFANDTVETQGPSVLDGFGAGAAIGFRVHPQFRLELDYSFRRNESGDWYTGVETGGVLTSLAVTDAAGEIDSHALMANSIFDLTRRRLRCVNVYGGGGIGMLAVDSDIVIPTATYDVADTAFAWQLIGGANFPLSKKVELFLEYRYLGAEKLDVTDVATGLPFGEFDYDSHNLFTGVRLYR